MHFVIEQLAYEPMPSHYFCCYLTSLVFVDCNHSSSKFKCMDILQCFLPINGLSALKRQRITYYIRSLSKTFLYYKCLVLCILIKVKNHLISILLVYLSKKLLLFFLLSLDFIDFIHDYNSFFLNSKLYFYLIQ